MRPLFPIGAAVAVAAVLAISLCNPVRSDSPAQQAKRGLLIAKKEGIPLNLKGKNKNTVGLGSYLVNAIAGCNECHTNPSYASGGDPFQGQPEQINVTNYLAGGRQFGPTIVSPNLTPDPQSGLPLGLTQKQFINVIRTGRAPDDGHILQVMPWPVYAKMSDSELGAIYQFLRAIPHAEPGQ